MDNSLQNLVNKVKCFFGIHQMKSGEHYSDEDECWWIDECILCHKQERRSFKYVRKTAIELELIAIRELLKRKL